MARRDFASAAVVLAAGLVLAGCGSSADSDSAAQSTPQSTAAATADSSAAPGATSEAATAPAATESIDFGEGVDELRDGTWKIGDAGEVEFTVQGRQLSLTEVRPAEGWQHRVDADDDDEFDVYFTRGNVEWKFEVEVDDDDDDDAFNIKKELKVRQASAGEYRVGSAGVVAFSLNGSTLKLDSATASPGWRITDREEDSDKVEVDFEDDRNGEAEFEVDTHGGGVEVEIRQKREGPLPR